MKRVLAVTAAATLMSIGLAPAAQAGEVTGNGKPTQMRGHAASICGFSGLDDVDEGETPATDDFGRTQNLGQIVKTVPTGFRSGITAAGCSPNAEPPEHEG